MTGSRRLPEISGSTRRRDAVFLHGWRDTRIDRASRRKIAQRGPAVAGPLGDADWLDGALSAGDLVRVSMLLRSKYRSLWTNIRTSPLMLRGEKPPRHKWRSPLN